MIVGREPSQVFKRPARHEGSARLVFEQVTIEDTVRLNCRLRSGEVVGFVGLRGAGQERVGRALFGLAPITGGRILLDERADHCLLSAPGDRSRHQPRLCRSGRGIGGAGTVDSGKPVSQSGRRRL